MHDQHSFPPMSHHIDDTLDSIPPPPSSETMAVWAPSDEDTDEGPDHIHYP